MPFAGRVWGLPFLTALAPSKRYAKARGRRHKSLTDRARQLVLLVARWLPDRRILAVADTSYAAIDLLAALRRHVTMITRLRLDAGLFDHPPPRQPTPMKRLSDPKTVWQRIKVIQWYGHGDRRLDIASGTAIWSRAGRRVPIRWVLVRDVEGLLEPQAFLCTDEAQEPGDILRLFVRRWSVEVTSAEVRRSLGVETQRQWSDLAIARTTPSLLALFSLVTLWTADLFDRGLVKPRRAAWYAKPGSPSRTPSRPSGATSGSNGFSHPRGPTKTPSKSQKPSTRASSKPLAPQPEMAKVESRSGQKVRALRVHKVSAPTAPRAPPGGVTKD